MHKKPSVAHSFATLALPVLLSACAAVVQSPATLSPPGAAQHGAPLVLMKDAELTLDTGYGRTLRAGSRWQHTGSVAQGDVYKPVQDVLTIEGAHMHEAWLVLSGRTVVGFYLPAERSFSPLRAQLALQLQ